mgnify:FL=1
MMPKQYSIDQDEEEEDSNGFLKAADSYEYIALDAEDHIVDMDDYIFNGINDNILEHDNHTDDDDDSIDGGDDDSIGSDGAGDRDDHEYDDSAAEDDDDGNGDYVESDEGILINRNAELYPQPVVAAVNFDYHLMDRHGCHRSNNSAVEQAILLKLEITRLENSINDFRQKLGGYYANQFPEEQHGDTAEHNIVNEENANKERR